MTDKKMDRSFETKPGPLTPADFPEIDWSDRLQLEELFPLYRRESLRMERERVKNINKQVNIEPFSLKTPNNSHYVFENTKLFIERNKRSAMYGRNGSGKTLLFKAMASGEIPDFPLHIHVHHMQEKEASVEADKISVIDTVVSSHPLRRVLVVMEEVLKKKVEESSAPESTESKTTVENLRENLSYVTSQLEAIRGYDAYDRAKKMLVVLGFDEIGCSRPLSSLSGGLRMRVALASAFFMEPELLLLDEPTNHLDFPSVLWLENRLRGYKQSYVLVTHDRTLLENVCTSVMLLQDKQISYFACGFKEFEVRRKKMDEKKNKEIDRFLAINRNIDPTSPLARTKMEMQAWQRKHYERTVAMAGKFTFKPPKELPAPAGTDQLDVSLINVDKVRFSYDAAKGLPYIFDEPISFDVKFGTRVGVMGPNGAGKSTFLKLLTGDNKPTEGQVVVNKDCIVAYFGQASTKELNPEETPGEYMQRMFPKEKMGVLKHHLAKTSIGDDESHTRMKNLSFSQRSCVVFAKLTYVPPHLLIMDEPTNFLDIDSVDSLISATNKFTGALMVVTHSRSFLKKTVKEYLSILPGQFLLFDNMQDAERSTYSFISALEAGEDIDLKNAITDNPGGGVLRTTDAVATIGDRNAKLQAEKKAKEDALKAEQERKENEEKMRAEKTAARKAAQKVDWKVDDWCYALPKGSKEYQKVQVVRVNGLGVSVKFANGANGMYEPNKVFESPPHGVAQKSAGGNNNNNKRGGAQGAGRGRGRGAAQQAGGGRGGARGRGGAGAGRGGARGGRR